MKLPGRYKGDRRWREPALPCALERANLFGVLAKVFCDSQHLTFAGQLRACVAAAVRIAKLGALDKTAIEKRALGKLAAAEDTLRTFELVREFEKRSALVTQYVAWAVSESAAEIVNQVRTHTDIQKSFIAGECLNQVESARVFGRRSRML